MDQQRANFYKLLFIVSNRVHFIKGVDEVPFFAQLYNFVQLGCVSVSRIQQQHVSNINDIISCWLLNTDIYFTYTM